MVTNTQSKALVEEKMQKEEAGRQRYERQKQEKQEKVIYCI